MSGGAQEEALASPFTVSSGPTDMNSSPVKEEDLSETYPSLSMMSSQLSIELLFAAECSWFPTTEPGRRIQGLRLESLKGRMDPERALALFRRHRILALAQKVLETHGSLDCLGQGAESLVRENAFGAVRNLERTRAEGAVGKLLASKSIPHQVLKGATLSHRIYGNPLLRHSKDIDLLVAPENLWTVVDLLEREGWIEEHPCLPRSAAYRWLLQRRWYHLEFHKSKSNLHLEVHWHVEEIPGSRLDEIWIPSLLAASPGDPIRPVEFLYLCAHGEHHSWMRLKWLGDLRAILDKQPSLWRESWDLAPDLGMRPALRQVEALLRLLYDFQPANAQPDSDTPLLVEAAIRSLLADDPADGVPWDKGFAGWWKSLRFAWMGYRRFGWRDRIRAFLWKECFNARDLILLRLPGPVLWLAPLARILLLAGRMVSPSLRRKRLEAYEH